MTIKEALDFIKAHKSQKYSDAQLIKWLNDLDTDIYQNIICKHEYNEGETEIEFDGYDENTDEDTEMLVPVPYDNIYTFFLSAQISNLQHEMNFYNNDIGQYKTLRDEFYARYHQDHMPVQKGKFRYY